MTFRPVCEFVDRSADQLLIGVRLLGADEEPAATFRLRLRTRWGRVPFVAEAAIVERVDAVGHRTRSALQFTVPVAQLANRAFRLELARAGGPGPAAAWVPVGTTPGLLACSRPEPVAERRVQVLPAAGHPATWLRLSSWTPGARAGWAVRNLARDLAFAAHTRRFAWVRAARALTRPLRPAGEIWLIGERRETARDNGLALFSYLRTQRPDAPIFYVIERDSPMAGTVADLGHVVWHSSLRHRVLMLHAHVLANAYSIKHMLPSRWRPGAYMNQCAWRVGARRVYLKHGVHLSPDAVKRANGGYDVVLTVGERETRALASTSGYDVTQLHQTGLARYDLLVPEHSRTVLFMPTWRRYLVPRLFGGEDAAQVPYDGSTYKQFVHGLLDSDELASLLEREELQMVVVPHYNLTGLLRPEHLASNRIRLLDGATADIPALLRSCALLLTDYSSVQFDAAYIGHPVVYAQFDREEYAAGHGGRSWFDPVQDGFGPVATTIADTLGALEGYARRDFAREARYGQRVAQAFAHRDRNNCARIAAVIDSLH